MFEDCNSPGLVASEISLHFKLHGLCMLHPDGCGHAFGFRFVFTVVSQLFDGTRHTLMKLSKTEGDTPKDNQGVVDTEEVSNSS